MKAKTLILISVMASTVSCSEKSNPIAQTVISLEKAALEKWYKGDPSGFYDIVANENTYFDPFLEKQLEGKKNFIKMMEPIRGSIYAERFEMLNPRVECNDNLAILSFNLASFDGGKASRWNCTEVFRLEADGQWRIIHSHWSVTHPKFAE